MFVCPARDDYQDHPVSHCFKIYTSVGVQATTGPAGVVLHYETNEIEWDGGTMIECGFCNHSGIVEEFTRKEVTK